MPSTYYTDKHQPFLRSNVNLLKASVKVLTGNKTAIIYSLHSSEKSVLINEYSTRGQGWILCLKKKRSQNQYKCLQDKCF